VRFLGTRKDVPEILSLIDVLALTSHIEANPVSILEAMAAGKPVVATRVGSVDRVVQEGRTGYIVAPGNEEEVVSRLIKLLSSRAEASTMGRAGRQFVVEHASIDRMVAGYEDLLAGIYRQKVSARRKQAGTIDTTLSTASARQDADPAGLGLQQSAR
jgi:glycosyltransferase involved in cell wall biosynthesis